MLARLFLLFTIVPILELFVLIPLGSAIGIWPTLGIIVATAAVGAWLGRQQGRDAWRRIRTELSQGKLPSESLLDGLLVLVACVLLVTPGVLTDVVGLTLLIPPTRKPIRKLLQRRFQKKLEAGDVGFIGFGSMGRDGSMGGQTGERREDVVDVADETVARPDSGDDRPKRLGQPDTVFD